jgi:uncharacterized phage protein (predicted DNA packaging)
MISLAQTKQFLRLEDDEEDFLIETLIQTAQKVIEDRIGYPIPEENPLPLKLACLQLVTQWYEERKPISFSQVTEIPNGASALINSYRQTL